MRLTTDRVGSKESTFYYSSKIVFYGFRTGQIVYQRERKSFALSIIHPRTCDTSLKTPLLDLFKSRGLWLHPYAILRTWRLGRARICPVRARRGDRTQGQCRGDFCCREVATGFHRCDENRLRLLGSKNDCCLATSWLDHRKSLWRCALA